MGRSVGRQDSANENPSVSAGFEPELDGYSIRPHTASVDCWCRPIDMGDGVWLHSDSSHHLDYVPDIKGIVQGDDA